MDNLPTTLSIDQLKSAINQLQSGGLDNSKVQDFVNHYKQDSTGSFVLVSSNGQTEQPNMSSSQSQGGISLHPDKNMPSKVPELAASAQRGIGGLITGAAKGVASTVKGAAELGGKILSPVENAINKATGYTPPVSEGDIATPGSDLNNKLSDALQAKTPSEQIGKSAEQVGEWLIPESKIADVEKVLSETAKGSDLVSKLTPIVGKTVAEGVANLGAKASVRAVEGGGIIGLQTGGDTQAMKTGALLSAATPLAGAVVSPAGSIASRLVKNLASGLSGASETAINSLIENPTAAKEAVNAIDTAGQESVLKKNAETIVNGVSKVRQEARKEFGTALESLSKEDINPELIKNEVTSVLDNHGISYNKKGVINFDNAEFTDPKNIKKADTLVRMINNITDLSGTGVRKVADAIESAKYKTANSDERLSFNAFATDLEKSLTNGINKTTDKLKNANAKFSQDMQLAQGVEDIFGKVKFKNLSEVGGVARKLESLFSQKGLDPTTVDNFLTRIGVAPSEFKATEAARQMGNISAKSNAEGVNVGEIVRSVTSAVLSPKAIRDATIFTGLHADEVKSIFDKLSPTARGAFIELFAKPK